MQKTTQSMIVLMVFAVGAIGGLWFYLHPGKATDTLAQANADLADISRNLDTLEKAASNMVAPANISAMTKSQRTNHSGGTGMSLSNLERPKCHEILTRLLHSSSEIGSTVLLNGQPAKATGNCRAVGNRIEVLM